jgi:hypothetical protein
LAELVAGRVSKGHLHGDLDGAPLGNHWARSPHAFTISSFLQKYYESEAMSFDLASRLGRPSAAYRFQYS